MAMRKGFYCRLALNNIKNNRRIYIPYMLSVVASVAMFYIIRSLSLNPGFEAMQGHRTMNIILGFANYVVLFFLLIFLMYTSSFLMKQRKPEFGLDHVLGMEKKHIIITLLWESLYVLLAGLVLGLLVGIVLDKLAYALLVRIIGYDVPLGFYISPRAIGSTVFFFALIMFISFLFGAVQIKSASPVDLLHASHVGEKEPKAKWLLALLGIVCVGAGYAISLTTTDALYSMGSFFLAVLLVIIGTYLLFTAGSIALLKLLKKNERFYYKTRHFISVSGMMYRMKQNAVGLSHICILSTMVLVTVSSTSALMFSLKDILYTRYPMQIMFDDYLADENDDQSLIEQIHTSVQDAGCQITDEIYAKGYELYVEHQGNQFITAYESGNRAFVGGYSLTVLPLSDYNQNMGTSYMLDDGEVLLYSSEALDTVELLGTTYRVKEIVSQAPLNGQMSAYMGGSYYMVVNEGDMERLNASLSKYYVRTSYYGININGDAQAQSAIAQAIQSLVDNQHITVECREDKKGDIYGLYGGIFFVGIFLGLLFLMATVLIIYYKQLSEGYADQKRFMILQQVGMTHAEVSSAIRSQVLMVFFLPLIVACIHTCFASPIVNNLLYLMNMQNPSLFAACLAGCFLVFAVIYALVYFATAHVYNQIVQAK